MNYEADDLLDHVDEWKFKLHDKLKTMTQEQRAAFWEEIRERAQAAGLPTAAHPAGRKQIPKRRRRATG